MKGICANCGKEVDLTMIARKETYPVKGELTTIEANVCVCSVCNGDVWVADIDDVNLRKAYEIYRQKHNLLMPAEIKEIREQYGLSQVAFSKILGFGDKTITRYENGSVQDEAPNNLILLVRNPSNFLTLYHRNKDKLTDEEIRQVEGKSLCIDSLESTCTFEYKERLPTVYRFSQPRNVIAFPNLREEAV